MPIKENTLAASAARTGANTFEATAGPIRYRGAIVFVDVTASSGDGTEDLAISIRTTDAESSKNVTLISDVFTDGATGLRAYLIYPGATDSQGAFQAIQATPLGSRWDVRAEVQQGGASPDFTYSISAVLLT